jgi:hypothetical protein
VATGTDTPRLPNSLRRNLPVDCPAQTARGFSKQAAVTDAWEGTTRVDGNTVTACRRDEWLIVEARDES